jgi:hypothetical protein
MSKEIVLESTLNRNSPEDPIPGRRISRTFLNHSDLIVQFCILAGFTDQFCQ